MTDSTPPAEQTRAVECIIPVLRVADLLASIRFYRDVLGFSLEWGGEQSVGLGSVGRDGCSIMLRGGAPDGPRSEVWIGVDNVDRIFADCQAAGVTILVPPRTRRWAREMYVKDPDGNVLWFGADPASGPDGPSPE